MLCGNPRTKSSRRVSSRATRARGGDRSHSRWFGPALALPATLFLLVFFLFPFYVVLSVAFGGVDNILRLPVPAWNPTSWNTGVLTYTISNVTHTDGLYHAALLRTFLYVGVATLLCLVIGYPFAYFLARHAGRWRGLFIVLFFAPFWISYMLRMLAWISILQDDGLLNTILMHLGLLDAPYPWLAGKQLTVVIGLVYGYVPFMVLPLFATLDRIHPSILEAGRDLGASPSQTFWRVTFPGSRQGILAGVVITSLPMFGDYFTQQLMANTGGTRMIGNAVVDALTIPLFVPRGAALILFLLVLLIVPILYYLRSTQRAAAMVRTA
jgi:ABC-type spermidine/putrescine transport system permease subunit I